MVGKIIVGTVWQKLPENTVDYYIGRSSRAPSPLGNPYVITPACPRDLAISSYKIYIQKEINLNNPAIVKELTRISKTLISGKDVLLRCYCKPPKDCHGRIIKEIVERALAKRKPTTKE